MTLDAPICPICSAAPFQCDHELLRWSYHAQEYEDSALVPLAQAYERAVEDLLEIAWQRREAPALPELQRIYTAGLEWLGEDWDREARLGEVGDQTREFFLNAVLALPGVVALEDDATLALYGASREAVMDALSDKIRALEVEAAREETSE